MKQCEVCREWIEKVKDVIFASVSEKRRKFLQQHSAVLRIGANTTADRFDEGQKRVQRELELLMAKHGTVDDTEEDLSEYDGSAFAEPEPMKAMVPALNGADQTRVDGSDYTEDTAASSGVDANNDQPSQDLTSSPIPHTEARHESQRHATEEDDGTPTGLPPHGNSCNAVTQPRCSDSGTDGVPPDDDKFREESLTSHAPPSPPLGEARDSLSEHGGPGENENGAAVDRTGNNTPGYNDGNDSGCNEAHHDDEDTYSEESLTNHESPSTLLGETKAPASKQEDTMYLTPTRKTPPQYESSSDEEDSGHEMEATLAAGVQPTEGSVQSATNGGSEYEASILGQRINLTPERETNDDESASSHDTEELTATLRSSTQTTVPKSGEDTDSDSPKAQAIETKRHTLPPQRRPERRSKRIQNQTDGAPKIYVDGDESS
eukprot:g11094.t1 g11094   contig5:75733-77034(-)